MKYLAIAASLLLMPPLAPAAMYKCTVAGKIKYQDMPCPSGAASSSVHVYPQGSTDRPSNASPNGVASDAPEQTELQRTQNWLTSRDLHRKKVAMDNEVDHAIAERDAIQKQMDDELAGLETKKHYAMNNLAGATWEQSISTEMQAVTTKYDAKLRSADAHIAELKAERAKLDD